LVGWQRLRSRPGASHFAPVQRQGPTRAFRVDRGRGQQPPPSPYPFETRRFVTPDTAQYPPTSTEPQAQIQLDRPSHRNSDHISLTSAIARVGTSLEWRQPGERQPHLGGIRVHVAQRGPDVGVPQKRRNCLHVGSVTTV